MNFWEIIKKRRSVRNFLPDPIPEADLKKILEAGRQCPSGGNGQNHFFGIVRDEKVKKELGKAAGGQEWIAEAPVIIALCTWIGDDLKDRTKNDFGLKVNKARFGSDFISFLNSYPDRRAVGLLWENGNCLIPGEHIFLAATAFGLNACWIGFLDIDRVGEILKLPPDIACHFLMPIGFAREEPEPPNKKELEEINFYDFWPGEGGKKRFVKYFGGSFE